MTSIFPASASVGQVFNSYTFDGTSWNIEGFDFNSDYLEESSASAVYLNKVSASTTYATIGSLNSGIVSASAAAVSYLVDSAPGALDTLNELAAALGDDANYASTITTALGNKAPIASPTFTGTLSSPTINATTKYQKNGSDITSIAYSDITVSAQAAENTYLLNLPAGVTNANFVSITPVSGVNNYLMITGFALGDWSGVQTSSQIRVRCFLGNGVHLEAFTLRVYYRV